MAIKLVELKQLGKETNETIISAKNEWISFLDFSAELYRYSTKNKVYMYAQRPDATAVASSKTWNNRMMRWIKKGSKGIGYIVHSNNRDHVEYVFDISDTMGIKGLSGIEPHKWRMNSDDRDQSVPYLIERYHPTLETVNTPTLKDAVNGYVNDYCNEIREDGDFSNETQYLIGSEDQWKEFENELSRLIASSSAYLIGRRCGFEKDELESLAEDIDISVFEKYNTDSEMLLNKVGSHIDDISTDFLRDLGTWVDKKHEREKRNEQRQNSIHKSRGLLSSESGDGRTKLSSEQVRGNALSVDDGTHEADGRNSELQMRDERTSGSDQQTGSRNDGTADEQNDEREWSNRRTESSESDAVAEQVYGDSERSGEDRTGSDSLQILEEPETVNQLEEVDSQVLIEQFSLFAEDGDTEEKQIEAVRQQASESIEDPLAFLISDKLVEKLLVKITSENKAVRDGVAGRLVVNLSDDEFAESLKSHVGKAYILNGIGFSVKGREESEGTYYSLYFADEGIKIGRGKSSENNYDRLVSWIDAAVMIKGLYSSGRWTTDAVIKSALTQARMNVAHSIANTFKESEVFVHIPKDILEVEDLVMHSWKNKAVAKSISQGLDRVIERGKSPYNEFAKGYKKDYLQLFGDEIIILQNNSELVDTYEIKSSFITDDVCNQIIADYMHPTRANGKFILQEMIEDGREQSAINNKIQALYGGETNNLFTNVLFMTGLQIKVPFTDDIRILDWNDVSDRIRTLIEEDKWLDSEEKIQYQKWHENRERENFFEELVIDGNRCNQIDTWESDNHTYVIGNSIDDTDFYFASVSGIEGDLIQGSATFEYDRQPSRERVESDYIDLMAERDIDAHEAEFGADGSRNFPHREENREQIPQDVIDDELCSGSNFVNGKKRIYEQFQKGMSDKENADFLKHEYGIGGSSIIANHHDYEQNHDSKGILIIKKSQDSFEERARLLLNWGNVAVRIKELINLGLYASEEEIATWAERPSEDVKQISVEEDVSDTDFINDEITVDSQAFSNSNEAIFRFANNCDLYLARNDDEYTYTIYYNGIEIFSASDSVDETNEDAYDEVYDIRKEHIKILGSVMESCVYGKMDIDIWLNNFKTCQQSEDKKNFENLKYDIVAYSELEKGDLIKDIGSEDDHIWEVTEINDTEIALKDLDAETFGGILAGVSRSLIYNGWQNIPARRILQNDNVIDVQANEVDAALNSSNEEYTPVEETENEILPQEQIEITKVDQPVPSKVNYEITDELLGVGDKRTKYQWNAEAIKTLKKIESEGRSATEEEQKILSKYVGWGGLSEVFDPSKKSWNREYKELQNILTDSEYSAASESTLTAYYTQPVVIKAIYEALHNMGFEKGNILEPSMGTGNFFGLLPKEFEKSKLYGVEKDSLTGRIAQQLYPNATVKVCGYEESNYSDSFFDVAVGNVPFGNFQVYDRQYNKLHFMIHDYFFAKTVDQLRTGGIMAFITSSGTMDKENSTARKYLAERCDLLGAIRLPNNAFKANAGTEVTSDIIFLKKRETLNPNIESWVDVSTERNGLTYNSYFVEHPEMVLGTIKEVSGQFGMTLTCEPNTETSLEEQLRSAIKNINGSYEETVLTTNDNDLDNVDETVHTIPADDNVQNFSFCEKEGKLYYRKDSVMEEWKGNKTAEERIRGLIKVRDAVKELIEAQVENIDDEGLKKYQEVLNTEYDTYTKKYGLLSSVGNRNAFKEDANYPLLLSLENLDDDGNLVSKADLFTKRTISRYEPVTSCETSNEAMILSLNEKAQIDLEYMSQLCGKSEETMIEDLKGIIYQDPKTKKWQTKDEYLSGNIKEKLSMAQYYAESDEKWQANVDALEKAMPKRVEAAELEVKLGATWVDDRYYTEFLHEKLNAMSWQRLDVTYSEISNEFVVDGFRRGDALYTATYGTGRMNAVDVFENAINFKSPKVYDKVDDRSIFNAKETMLINQKMNMFRQEFKDWIFADQERRDRLVDKYNERFNTTRPREYDGSHLIFPNMNPSIKLRPHQLDAAAHVLYGDNTMLAHVVGAGKTYEMIASCMESERLGLSQKALFVVPNHLTEQWGADFLKLYPSAKVLVAKKTDFTPQNRKAFCARIATGNYDAIIIGHTQFERIPLSNERQESYLRAQIDEITNAIQSESSPYGGKKASVKALERTKRGIERRLKKLLDTKKDQIVTFEQLGIDRLFVDEAHNYKNGFLYTKMQNVAGINNSESNKASDMLLKCRYMDEKTGGKGIVFATGTPISNSMTELYIMQNYLQHDLLKRMHISSFDEWASVFGETETGIELAPEGTGYRMKTRFSKFYNIPELMSVVKESFDIKTSDQLKLPVPDAEYTNVELLPSEFQNIYVKDLADRAEAVRNGSVDNSIDNMLKITNDGRKIALDQRMIDASTGDYEDSKVDACAENAYAIYEKTRDQKSAQVIFCDLSTPKADGTFNVYDEMKKKLIEKGVKEEEIEFIHSADTEKKKTELFRKVNTGDVRILIGSTAKMGAGTNIQNKLIALHHLDIGWRPSDLEQREGRIIRQGNENEKVYIYRYVTKNTFDAYMWQLIENKQKFISQIMTSKSPARTCNDVDETALSYAEVKALATGNPLIKEKMEIDVDVEKLKLLKKSFQQAKWQMESEVKSRYPVEIAQRTQTVEDIRCDLNAYRKFKDNNEDFEITLLDRKYTDKEEAGTEIIKICDSFGLQIEGHWQQIGSYHGFDVAVKSSTYGEGFSYSVGLQGKKFYNGQLNRRSKKENISRIDSIFETIETRMNSEKKLLTEAEHNLEVARIEVTKPFAQEEELQKKLARQVELNDLLSMDNTSEEESQDEEPKALDLIESHQFEADDDDATVEFENMILYVTRTEQDEAKVDYFVNDRESGCMTDCGSWFDDCNVTADLKEAVKSVIKDKDITEQILSVNDGDRFEEITGTLPVRQSGGQSM